MFSFSTLRLDLIGGAAMPFFYLLSGFVMTLGYGQSSYAEGGGCCGGELPNDGAPGDRIEAGGAVVRCQRISPHMEHYEVAVFLHDATETTRRKIAQYVDRVGGR